MFRFKEIPNWLKGLSPFGLLVFLLLGIQSDAFAQPANDNCLTAQPIIIPPSGTICINSSSIGATSSNTTNTCNLVAVNEVWFSYITAGSTNIVTITPNGGTPIQQAVTTISDAPCGSGTYSACDASATPGGTASANWAYAAGTQIFVSVAGIMADGDFEICITSETVPPPPGGSPCGATPSCDPSDFTLASSAGFTPGAVSPSCFLLATQNVMWFVFSVGQSGTFEFTADLNGVAEYDWAVYGMNPNCNTLTELSCNYFFSGGNSGMIGLQNPAGGEFNAPINVIAGNTYGIMIDNYDANGVGFDFTWGGTFQMAPTADFTINSPTDCNSLTTAITNNSVGASTYSWDFGNGQTSALQNPPAQNYNTPGTYFVTLDATSAAGCTNSMTASVEVFPDPTVSFTPTDESCTGACDGQLVANASGNGPFSYSWNGLPGNTATQTNLCAANYDVTVTDLSNGCTGSGTGTVGSGGATSDASITPAGPFCPADAPVNLVGADAGGTWSRTGITNAVLGTFDPSVAGIGTWTITYTIAGPCGDVQTTDIVVNGLLDPSITPAGPFCLGENPINLVAATAGGTWSGTGITDAALGTFDPALAGQGSWPITYTIPGACGDTDTESITVGPNSDATITPVGPFCSSEPAVNLVGATAGGIWSGTGITDAVLGTFAPSVAGLGTWTITYTIAGACGDFQTTDIEVGEITFSQSLTDATCFGSASGEILIQNPTGTAPHEFSIDGGTTFQPAPLFQSLSASNYSLVVEDANGCQSAPVPVVINEPSAIQITTSMDQESNCGNPNGVASATALGGTIAVNYQYSWNSTPPQFTSIAAGLPPAVYTVTITDDNGCSETANVEVTATAGFSASISSFNDPICNGSCDGDATALTDNLAINPITYSWNDPGTQNTATAIGLCSGDVTVTITDAVGCVATATATLSDPPLFTAEINPSATTICIGESATLITTFTGGTALNTGFDWTSSPIDPTLVNGTQSPVVSPLIETTYSLIATDVNGCEAAPVDVTISLSSALSLDVLLPLAGDTAICQGDNATINLSASGGNGVYSYFQQPDLLNPISLPVSVQPVLTNTYDFVVTDGCGTPPANASSTVTVNPIPSADFEVDDPTGCQPHLAIFTDLTSPAPATWTWDFGDPNSGNNTSSDQHPNHAYSNTGVYDVSLSVVSAEGCSADVSYSSMIEVFTPPIADFETDTNSANILNSTFNFTDLTSGSIAEWNWDFGDGSVGTDQHPSHTYLDTGAFFIQLTAISVDGCESTAIDRIYINPIRTFYVPNSFTPDKDHINDGFRAFGEGYDWSTYEMVVFNRWGQEIFRTNNIEEVWNGTFKGNPVENDIYAWRVHVSDFNGRVYPFKGFISVLRQFLLCHVSHNFELKLAYLGQYLQFRMHALQFRAIIIRKFEIAKQPLSVERVYFS